MSEARTQRNRRAHLQAQGQPANPAEAGTVACNELYVPYEWRLHVDVCCVDRGSVRMGALRPPLS